MVSVFNLVYSNLFLAFIVGALVWLYLCDMENFRLFRTALGISAALTIAISAAFPVAPPRLYAPSGLIDTHLAMGLRHGFLNQYAAVPSLHVGWSVLAAVMVARSTSGRWGRLIGTLSATTIILAVVVTGNHYWLDGVVGAAICLGPLYLLTRPTVRAAARATAETLVASERARFSALALGGMLLVLLIGQLVDPGFTDHWGYLTPQVAATLVVAVGGEAMFRREGGLFTWQTHLVVAMATAADLLGTAGHMYDRHASYDKIVHFWGTAATTAVVLDLLNLLARHGRLSWTPSTVIVIAMLAGIWLGAAWEIYEYVGDHVFNSTRTGGFWDTTYDLIFDAMGAVVIACSAAWQYSPWHVRSFDRAGSYPDS
jgi:hypothetical protein